jgi:hypothetical protein
VQVQLAPYDAASFIRASSEVVASESATVWTALASLLNAFFLVLADSEPARVDLVVGTPLRMRGGGCPLWWCGVRFSASDGPGRWSHG